jgi:uncharacterized protein
VITVLRAADRIALPWKNGGGVTREVVIWPPGADLENFDWRVSIAEVREAGPFSRFENIDRTLMILGGRLMLTFAERETELGPDSAPCIFPGDASCFGTPVDGSVTDLNVMTRRGRGTACITAIANDTHSVRGKTSLLLIRNETKVRVGEREFQLAPLDALLIGEPCQVVLEGAALLIEFG